MTPRTFAPQTILADNLIEHILINIFNGYVTKGKMRDEIKVMKCSNQPSVCVSEVLTCRQNEKRASCRCQMQKGEEEESFKCRTACDYCQGAVIEQYATANQFLELLTFCHLIQFRLLEINFTKLVIVQSLHQQMKYLHL